MFGDGFKATLFKLYAANFLTGLVFWYAIEKLFVQNIGLKDDLGALLFILTLLAFVLDIPSGMLADRWSRKGMLVVSLIFLAASAITMGTSNDFWQYLLGYIFYGLYLVGTSGTYHALTYDILYEHGRSADYSKIMGRVYALFLIGAGVANIVGGFLGQIDLRLVFMLSAIPALLNIFILLSIAEPRFHKESHKETMLRRISLTIRSIWKAALLRSLVIMYVSFSAAEVFKQDFSQFYMLAFNNSTVLLGFFWAAYAFAWAAGSFLAHYVKNRLNILLVVALGSYGVMALWHSPWALGVFIVQAVAAAAAFNLIETQVQNATPSSVRTSILSVLATFDRLVKAPLALILGWLLAQYDIFALINFVAVICMTGLAYWLCIGKRRLGRPVAITAQAEEPYAKA